jgi:putative FmdB family regulatory protein
VPLYEFSCRKCGIFERRLPVERASDPIDCPSCAVPAARVFSSIQVRRGLAPWQAARERDRVRMKHARSGEPRVEHRAPDGEASTSGWQPLHNTYGRSHDP